MQLLVLVEDVHVGLERVARGGVGVESVFALDVQLLRDLLGRLGGRGLPVVQGQLQLLLFQGERELKLLALAVHLLELQAILLVELVELRLQFALRILA